MAVAFVSHNVVVPFLHPSPYSCFSPENETTAYLLSCRFYYSHVKSGEVKLFSLGLEILTLFVWLPTCNDMSGDQINVIIQIAVKVIPFTL